MLSPGSLIPTPSSSIALSSSNLCAFSTYLSYGLKMLPSLHDKQIRKKKVSFKGSNMMISWLFNQRPIESQPKPPNTLSEYWNNAP